MLRKLFRRTPLAWLQLKKEKTRLAVALAGIAFADMLMFVQMGLLDALLDSATQAHQNLQADLVLINPQFQSLISVKSFPRERLQQTLAYDRVKSVRPLYINVAQWRNPETRITRSILVWGIDPANPPFDNPEVNKHLGQLKLLDRVLFDLASRPEYGPIPDLVKQHGSMEAEVNSQTVQTVGLFQLGVSFGADGNIISSDSTFLKLFPERKPNQIEVGLINLEPGANVQAVRSQLKAALPNDVKVLTPQEFAQTEIDYWSNQGIGFIFGMGAAVGFIVGIVIVYQILYADVSDHLPEYATLKAMGYSDRYLMTMLMQEALLLAVLGFIPGVVLSIGLYQITYAATLIPIGMKLNRAIFVLLLTIVMCSSSGAIALRKLRAADPADMF
ncbi:MAG: FtsX-like permease family protein [Chlorogloeopsis fritschii C42_A2020_084]|uniref:ABC transporter permease DevC n=1 Tax=Chlorogloeopsis fritschii TaxID=1124 RepID=UPI0019EB90B4|nr:ABC transporter permease DevC [Chlorogloeopsis fritschii]MBF2007911.1 FtsX-like permease family protein [Chlorogloeopsis fritschii C42_A2020_084]